MKSAVAAYAVSLERCGVCEGAGREYGVVAMLGVALKESIPDGSQRILRFAAGENHCGWLRRFPDIRGVSGRLVGMALQGCSVLVGAEPHTSMTCMDGFAQVPLNHFV